MNALYLRTIPKALRWLALISLVFLLFKVFILNEIQEAFHGAHELGVVFEGVLASVLASYVFYLIVVHLKEINDKRVIYPHIIGWARFVIVDCKDQLSAFEKESGVGLPFATLTQEQVNEAFKKINPYGKAPLAFSLNNYANWLQFFEYHKNRSKQYISKIMSQLIFLEASLVSLLTKIDDCIHFNIVEILARFPINNVELGAFAENFFKYCEYCRALDEHLQNYVGKYGFR